MNIVLETNKGILIPPTQKANVFEIDLFSGAEEATFTIYCKILNRLKNAKICRMWNFIPKIHADDLGKERYRQFCVGRLRAFQKFGLLSKDFPAASAVGSFENHLKVAVLTSAQDSLLLHISNVLQTNPWDYPEQYGPVGPSFARATIEKLPHSSTLYVSGTASIRGHKTLHPDDILMQTKVTLENIERLFQSANEKNNEHKFLPEQTSWRIYLRNPNHQAIVARIILETWGAANMEFCHAEICRSDLLVEIEGIANGKI